MIPFYQYLFLGIIQVIFFHSAIHDNVEVHCCVIAMKGQVNNIKLQNQL